MSELQAKPRKSIALSESKVAVVSALTILFDIAVANRDAVAKA